MSLKQKIENNILIILIATWGTGFGVGFAAYQKLLSIGAMQVVLKSELLDLKKENNDLKNTVSNLTAQYQDLKSVVHVDIYWHQQGFTAEKAKLFKEKLQKNNIKIRNILEHLDPNPPDSIFIGALVNAQDARIVLSSIPYQVNYIFPLEYPREKGGDPEGLLIGVGYLSNFKQEYNNSQSIPIKISKSDFASLIEEGISNTEFQQRLRRITSRGANLTIKALFS